MNRAQRRALLGDDVIAHLRDRVEAAPVPGADVVDQIRLVFTRPAGRSVMKRPAADAA